MDIPPKNTISISKNREYSIKNQNNKKKKKKKKKKNDSKINKKKKKKKTNFTFLS